MLVNLTLHPIIIEGVGTIPTSGRFARVSTRRVTLGSVEGVRVTLQTLGKVEGLPAPKEGTIYIVSSMVLDALKKEQGVCNPRTGRDVFAPDTGEDAIREGGQIVAVRGLVC